MENQWFFEGGLFCHHHWMLICGNQLGEISTFSLGYDEPESIYFLPAGNGFPLIGHSGQAGIMSRAERDAGQETVDLMRAGTAGPDFLSAGLCNR